jgi:hypothetical protein
MHVLLICNYAVNAVDKCDVNHVRLIVCSRMQVAAPMWRVPDQRPCKCECISAKITAAQDAAKITQLKLWCIFELNNTRKEGKLWKSCSGALH